MTADVIPFPTAPIRVLTVDHASALVASIPDENLLEIGFNSLRLAWERRDAPDLGAANINGMVVSFLCLQRLFQTMADGMAKNGEAQP